MHDLRPDALASEGNTAALEFVIVGVVESPDVLMEFGTADNAEATFRTGRQPSP